MFYSALDVFIAVSQYYINIYLLTCSAIYLPYLPRSQIEPHGDNTQKITADYVSILLFWATKLGKGTDSISLPFISLLNKYNAELAKSIGIQISTCNINAIENLFKFLQIHICLLTYRYICVLLHLLYICVRITHDMV